MPQETIKKSKTAKTYTTFQKSGVNTKKIQYLNERILDQINPVSIKDFFQNLADPKLLNSITMTQQRLSKNSNTNM